MKSKIYNTLINNKNGMFSRENIFKKHFPEIYIEICNIQFPEDFTFIQKIYHWCFNDYDFKLGICPTCGNRCSFIRLNSGYYDHCSVSCADSDKHVLDLKRKTKYERHGDPNFNNRKKAEETCEKIYGVKNPGQAEICKAKSRKTKFEKHGYEFYTNREKASRTVREKYNVDNISQIDFVKEKKVITNLKNTGYEYTFQNPEMREKSKKACFRKYGTNNYSNSSLRAEHDRIRFKNIYEEYKKAGLTVKCGISKTELDFYKYLLTKFDKDDIVYSYMSDEYPFRCDFYIKSLNLYVELNCHWTHGGHPFDKTNAKDIEIINLWKNKHDAFYDNAIKTWTASDVKKRKTAKQNGLNYIELFDKKLNDIINCFEEQMKCYENKTGDI